MMNKLKSHPDQLAAAFDFTPADLAANRVGVLSERQSARIRTKANIGMGVALLAFAGICIGLITGLYILSVFGGYVLLFVAPKHTDGLRHAKQDQVKSVESNVRLEIRQKVDCLVHTIPVIFRVTSEQLITLRDQEPYVIYYLESPHRIVSVESLRDDSPFVAPDDA